MAIEIVNINGELFEVDEDDPRHSSNQFRDSQEVLDENEAIFQTEDNYLIIVHDNIGDQLILNIESKRLKHQF